MLPFFFGGHSYFFFYSIPFLEDSSYFSIYFNLNAKQSDSTVIDSVKPFKNCLHKVDMKAFIQEDYRLLVSLATYSTDQGV